MTTFNRYNRTISSVVRPHGCAGQARAWRPGVL